MPKTAHDASGLAGLQEALELLGLAKLPAEAGVVTQAFWKMSLAVHPDKKGGNASSFANC